MRRLYAWIAGTAGGVATLRLLKRRSEAALEQPAPPSQGPDPRAEELRAKLAASTGAQADTAASATAEVAAEPEAAAPGEDPEERRRRIHEAGRAALDEMGESG